MSGLLGLRRHGKKWVQRSSMPVDTGTTLGIRYRLRERLLTSGDDFVIETVASEPAFRANGKTLSGHNSLSLTDIEGRETYLIQNNPARMRESMTIYRNLETAAVIYKALFTPLRNCYWVNIHGSSDLFTHGDILQHEYSIKRLSVPVANVSKRWCPALDTYGGDIASGEDDLLTLAVTICIDAMAFDG